MIDWKTPPPSSNVLGPLAVDEYPASATHASPIHTDYCDPLAGTTVRIRAVDPVPIHSNQYRSIRGMNTRRGAHASTAASAPRAGGRQSVREGRPTPSNARGRESAGEERGAGRGGFGPGGLKGRAGLRGAPTKQARDRRERAQRVAASGAPRGLSKTVVGLVVEVDSDEGLRNPESPRHSRLPGLAVLLGRVAPCGACVVRVRRACLALSVRQDPGRQAAETDPLDGPCLNTAVIDVSKT